MKKPFEGCHKMTCSWDLIYRGRITQNTITVADWCKFTISRKAISASDATNVFLWYYYAENK